MPNFKDVNISIKSDVSNRNNYRPYKSRKSFATRKEEVEAIMKKFPTKIPVVIERYYKETTLPLLDKTKYLVPQEITMSQFVSIIRNRTELNAHQTFFMLINNKSISSMSKTVVQVYNEYKEDDGFLYITYASQEVFGFKDIFPSDHIEINSHDVRSSNMRNFGSLKTSCFN